MAILLTRDAFRDAVFNRDGYRCVFCREPAADAHHIMERRLFDDGGYNLDNGASVCARHHMLCETTELSVEDVRLACGIARPILPPHLYRDQIYDKWGNPILPNGQRLKGELFFDESVQKVLKRGGVLESFSDFVKYPRTHHVPWSQSITSDDRVLPSLHAFLGKRVIATEKMDGENTSMYRDHIHARSVCSGGHESRNWVKRFWSSISYEIPEAWRVCGENLYAAHSIHYKTLPSYFMGFSVWNERNECLSWDDTLLWFELLGITAVPVLYDGTFDEKAIRSLWEPKQHAFSEGYVLRVADSFAYGEFRLKVGKFVRKDHVQTVKHWMHGQRIVPNELQ